ncbi:MAG TPA: murein L,D-transpeptidase catalytic domain family protein [bacterium]|nr:murein L,D-transpeptidase catalytic domain family protein [bacterium]
MRRLATMLTSVLLLAPAIVHAQTMSGECAPSTRDSVGALVGALHGIAAAAPAPLPFHVAGLSDDKLAVALRAYSRAQAAGIVKNPRLTIIDYTQPSTSRRLFVIDPVTGRVLHRELVAHGRGSGDLNATAYGNVPDSFRTSLGVFRTAETYSGKHGYSLRLDGLEPGVNSNARDREIVMHAADYVSDAFIHQTGRLGRSEGCPALDPKVAKSVIDDVKGGSIIVSLGTDPSWIARSRFAHP